MYKCIFDLPGLCSIGNVTQFNGEYGCPFCFHPGVQVQVGHGSARKYPFVRDVVLRSDEHYRQCLRLAEAKKVFGIKGVSPLFQVLRFPEDIIFDPMHALFEGVAKQYLLFSVNPSVCNHPLKFKSKCGSISQRPASFSPGYLDGLDNSDFDSRTYFPRRGVVFGAFGGIRSRSFGRCCGACDA